MEHNLTPEEAQANLAFMTNLMSGGLDAMQGPDGEPVEGQEAIAPEGAELQASQGAQDAPQGALPPEMTSAIGKAVREAVQSEMESFRSTLQDALNEDETGQD